MLTILPFATVMEVGLLLVAWYAVYRSRHLLVSLSLTYAVVSLLATLSWVAQITLLAGVATYSPCWDLIGDLWALMTLQRHRILLGRDLLLVVSRIRAHPILASCGFSFLAYLGLQALLLPPFNNDSLAYNLTRIFFCIQERTLFPASHTCLHQLVFPIGYDVIHFWMLRSHTDFGIGIFGFLCYVGILTGTYAHVSAGGKWRGALMATLVVGTLMDVVLTATSTKNDLPCGLLALTSLLAIAANVRDGKRIHIILLGVALTFGMSVKTYFVGWVGLVFVYGLWEAIRRRMSLWNAVTEIRKVALWPVLLLSTAILFYSATGVRFGHPFGPDEFRRGHGNRDGVGGTVVNACRYGVQLIQWPRLLGGKVLTNLHDRLLGNHAEIATMMNTEVDLAGPSRAIIPQEDLTWYGITSWLFVIPALLWTLRYGERHERIASWLCVMFVGMLCAEIGWAPWNGRFFLTVFACSAFWIRGPLERLTLFPFARMLLIGLCIIQGLGSALLNLDKPFIDIYGAAAILERKTGRVILNRQGVSVHVSMCLPYWLGDVVDRERHYNAQFGNRFVTKVRRQLATCQRLGVAAPGSSVYPFLLGLHLPLNLLIAAESLDQIQTDAVDALLVLGNRNVNPPPGFEVVAMSDMDDPNCQMGTLLKRVSH